jgi:hypothetical protein
MHCTLSTSSRAHSCNRAISRSEHSDCHQQITALRSPLQYCRGQRHPAVDTASIAASRCCMQLMHWHACTCCQQYCCDVRLSLSRGQRPVTRLHMSTTAGSGVSISIRTDENMGTASQHAECTACAEIRHCSMHAVHCAAVLGTVFLQGHSERHPQIEK